jgi:hypothetical protein
MIRAASRRRLIFLATIAGLVSAAAGAARASAPPVGPLPPGPTATVVTHAGELVAVALPHRPGSRTWRLARAYDSAILHETSEADVGPNVVLVFKTTRPGRVTLAFGLTRGETAKAFESRTFKVQVR